MSEQKPKLEDWLGHEETVQRLMAEFGLSREEVEQKLEEFDRENPASVDRKPPQ
jgi:hypothetical protein